MKAQTNATRKWPASHGIATYNFVPPTAEVTRLHGQAGRKAVLRCQFMVNFFGRHPEYADVVAG